MIDDHALVDILGRIHFPSPGTSSRIRVMSPAEKTTIGTGERRSCFHTRSTVQAVEGMFITSSITSQMSLTPSAQLHSTICNTFKKHSKKHSKKTIPVRTYNTVTLLQKKSPLFTSDHFLRSIASHILQILFSRQFLYTSRQFITHVLALRSSNSFSSASLQS